MTSEGIGLRLSTVAAVMLTLGAWNPGMAAPPIASDALSAPGGAVIRPGVDFPGLTPKQMIAALNVLYGVDFNGLAPDEVAGTVQVLKEEKCSCGCGMQMSICLTTDEHCGQSREVTTRFIAQLRRGLAIDQARAAIFGPSDTCLDAKAPAAPLPILDAARVEIPIGGAPTRGPKNAKVTIVEFSDFQCGGCAQASGWVHAIAAAYPKDVRIVFKQFPLDFHEHANEAAQASLAANEQGKFWALHDKMFAHGESLSREAIRGWATEIGLDVKALEESVTSGRYRERIDADIADGMKLGVQGTPWFFINGRHYNGVRTLEAVTPVIESEIKAASPKSASSTASTIQTRQP